MDCTQPGIIQMANRGDISDIHDSREMVRNNMGSIHVVKDEAQILPYCILHLTAHTEMGKRADAAWGRKATCAAGAAVLILSLALLIFCLCGLDGLDGMVDGWIGKL